MYKGYLEAALTSLFKPAEECGFWDNKDKRIIERLHFTEKWQWNYTPSDKMRYMVFCLSNLLLAKDLFNLNTIEFNTKISQCLIYLNKNKEKLTTSDLTYGALLAIFLHKKNYDLPEINISEWEILFEKALDETLNRKDNHDALILVAGKYLIQQFPNHKLIKKLKLLTDRYLLSQNSAGYFETGDIRANYHQRNMYVLWGLAEAVSFYPEKREEIRLKIHKTLSWVWSKRRDNNDDAFHWHAPFYLIKNKFGFKMPVLNIEHSKFLFECHQTFFINAVNFYQLEFRTKEFEEEKIKAIDWIFGKNRINKNLVDVTGIGQPVRIMHTNGNLFLKGQNFIGTYEIGSYVLSLASFNK